MYRYNSNIGSPNIDTHFVRQKTKSINASTLRIKALSDDLLGTDNILKLRFMSNEKIETVDQILKNVVNALNKVVVDMATTTS